MNKDTKQNSTAGTVNLTAGMTMDGALRKGINLSEGLVKKGGIIAPMQSAPAKRPPPPPAQKPKQ